MLPEKLNKLKSEIENQLYRSEDDKKALQLLKLLDTDANIQKLISQSDFLTKSFSATPDRCPVCGK